MNVEEVARLAGVSKATVSRVLNNRPGVSEEKYRRVKAVLAQTDSLPRTRARASNSLTGNIGVLTVTEDAFAGFSAAFNAGLRGVRRALAERGLNMVLGQAGRGLFLPPLVADGKVDGLILAGHDLSPELKCRLRRCPMVWLTSHREEGSKEDVALVGNDAVGKMAAEYLVERGCRHLAFMDLFSGSPSLRARHEMFAFVAHRNGLKCTELKGGFDYGDTRGVGVSAAWKKMEKLVASQIRQMAKMENRPDGLVVPVGEFAGLVYRLLRENGQEPGRDIEVVVCGLDIPVLAALSPRPAVIDLNSEAMGRRAVEQLLWRIRNPSEGSGVTVLLEPRLLPPEEDLSSGRA